MKEKPCSTGQDTIVDVGEGELEISLITQEIQPPPE